MPPKKIPSTKTESHNVIIQLTKSINELKKSRDQHIASVEKCDQLISDFLEDISVTVEQKQKELDKLDREYETKATDLKIDLEQEFKADARTKALEVLEITGEIPVDKESYENLQSELSKLKSDQKDLIDEAVKTERQSAAKSAEYTKRTLELTHKAEVAKSEAAVDQLKDHVAVLESQIESLKGDIEKQRNLTQAVAEASRPQMQQYQPMPQGKYVQ